MTFGRRSASIRVPELRSIALSSRCGPSLVRSVAAAVRAPDTRRFHVGRLTYSAAQSRRDRIPVHDYYDYDLFAVSFSGSTTAIG